MPVASLRTHAIVVASSLVAVIAVACGSSDSSGGDATQSGAGGATSTTASTGDAKGSTSGSGTGASSTATSITTGPDAGPPPFPLGHVFIAGSRNAEVFEYDPMLNPISHWTVPDFGTVEAFPGQDYSLGPAGMAFDAKGDLVVATLNNFCVFSAPNQLLACHPKFAPEPTENLIFDLDGNVYTTTATGGTNAIRVYDSSYNYVASYQLPTDNLTGVTCDAQDHLFIASQQITDDTSIIYKVDRTSFTVLDQFTIQGTAEGLQLASDGNILVGLDGGEGIARVHASSPTVVVGTITDPALTWAVPLTTDNDNNIYTADYENGAGTAAADLFVFDASGNKIASRPQSEVWGPFGMVVAGAVLPCGAFQNPK